MEKKAGITRTPLMQAIAAVVITAIGYASSYFFESGYLSMFGVDAMFAQVTTSVLIIGATTTLLIGAAMWVLVWGVFNLPTKGRPMREYIQMLTGIGAISFILLIIISIISDTVFALLLIPVIGFCVFSFLLFLFVPLYDLLRRKKGFRASIESVFGLPQASKKDGNKKMDMILWMVLGCIIVATSFSLGRYSAASVATFSTTNRDGVCRVIIRKYGDELITKTVDMDGTLKGRAVTILKMQDGMRIESISKSELANCKLNNKS